MLDNTRKISISSRIHYIKTALIIDKNSHWCNNISIREKGDIYVSK